MALVTAICHSPPLLALIFLTSCYLFALGCNGNGVVNSLESEPTNSPNVSDSHLEVQLVFQKEFERKGNTLSPISTMEFVGANDILLLDKNNGTVRRIVNGVLLKDPLLDVNVANKRERGMLGIESITHARNGASNNSVTYIYLYYTESKTSDGTDVCRKTYYCKPGTYPIGNNLYAYELKNNKLINPKLLLQLPAWPAPSHNGGIIKIGPDNNLYISVGDMVGSVNESSSTKAQNYKNGTDPDGRAGILRVTPEGKPVPKPVLGDEFPLNLYYAYGIRNSFGIAFDPLTGKLWDTENGPDYGDEINLVDSGFNSGWSQIQGLWKPKYDIKRGGDLIAGKELMNSDLDDLVDFGGNGKYSPPEFTWNKTVAPTAIEFLNSDKYGNEYENDLFLGDSNNGFLYHFDLNKERSGLFLEGPLKDGVANSLQELEGVILGGNFGVITDIDIGNDGYLYLLSDNRNTVKIFRIVPKNY